MEDTLYTSNVGAPIVLQCNYSDLFSDAEIIITDSEGQTLKWSPFISLRNGKVYNKTEDGKMYDINGNLTGAQLYEFDLASGLVVATKGATGYCSQAKRQSACFSMKDPSKMYWNGFYNSGMGYNAYGNWGPLPDSDWNNGKYDTALYEVDINTGETTRIAKITNRFSFSCMWVVEDDSPVVAGDVNGDGLVTSIDITVLYNYLLLGDAAHIQNKSRRRA